MCPCHAFHCYRITYVQIECELGLRCPADGEVHLFLTDTDTTFASTQKWKAWLTCEGITSQTFIRSACQERHLPTALSARRKETNSDAWVVGGAMHAAPEESAATQLTCCAIFVKDELEAACCGGIPSQESKRS